MRGLILLMLHTASAPASGRCPAAAPRSRRPCGQVAAGTQRRTRDGSKCSTPFARAGCSEESRSGSQGAAHAPSVAVSSIRTCSGVCGLGCMQCEAKGMTVFIDSSYSLRLRGHCSFASYCTLLQFLTNNRLLDATGFQACSQPICRSKDVVSTGGCST